MSENTKKTGRGKMGKLWRFTRGFFALIGFFVVLSIVTGVVLSRPGKSVQTGAVVLTFDFKRGLGETADRPSFDGSLLRPKTVFADIIAVLSDAASNPAVKGFVARLENPMLSYAQVQELRAAIKALRDAGKFAYVYADTFNGTADYYLATAFEQVWLQPAGAVMVTGLGVETPFVRGLLDKAGVAPDFRHRGRYKSAPETFTETQMSKDAREMMIALLSDMSSQVTEGIAADRKLSQQQVMDLIDEAPWTDAQAVKRNLVDQLGYYEDLIERAKEKAGGKARLVKIDDLDPPAGPKTAPKIALVVLSGVIGDESGAEGKKTAAAIRKAAKDENVSAIVLRIDSPGGSASASETIRQAVVQAREKGKPVVVSMGGMAASGGYWVASGADRIVAAPATLTGSIGVFGGKISLAPLWDKIGVNWELIAFGENAGMFSPNRRFSPTQGERFQAMLDSTYETFLDRVAEGRDIDREKAQSLAEGYVFTGRQAVANGLADRAGGIAEAVDEAKKLAGLAIEAPVRLELFPRRRAPLELLVEALSGDESVMARPAAVLVPREAELLLLAPENLVLYEPLRLR